MKKSLSHLSQRMHEQLNGITTKVLEKLPDAQMIILYGSYARGDYVEFDRRIEFGIPTTFMSDYDILVITHGVSDVVTDRKLENVSKWYRDEFPGSTPVQFIHDDIAKVNKDLSDGRFFYNDVKKEGIMLYNSENFKLERRRKLRFDEIKEQAEEYYRKNYKRAELFFTDARNNYTIDEYVHSSFHLHQACENLLKAVSLTYTLYSPKQHDLEALLDAVKKYSLDGFFNVFPRQTKRERRLFDLLKAAYIEARYNPKFVVTQKDIEELTPTVEKLLALGKQLCEQRIEEYEAKI